MSDIYITSVDNLMPYRLAIPQYLDRRGIVSAYPEASDKLLADGN